MKILWVSNSPWSNSGYGSQTRLFVPRIADAGHEIAMAVNHGLNGSVSEWTDDAGREFRVYPSGFANYSADVIPGHAEDWFDGDPGLVLTLYDVWAMRNPLMRDLNIAAWCPVDHWPVPPAVKMWFNDYGATPIAMAHYGEQELTKAGLDPLYVPHGVDTKKFHPVPDAKARMGLDPDEFLVGMVAANVGRNPSRKAFPENLLSFAFFGHDHPDARLYVHSEQYGHLDGIELDVLATACGITPEQMRFADQYQLRQGMSDEAMAVLYSAFDVLLFASMGEGFGIPALEAQACGTPVIVSDFSAQPELVAPGAGYKVGVQPSAWDATQRAFFCTPLVSEIVGCLEHAYQNRDALKAAGEKARVFVVENYDADVVFDKHWLPVLETLEAGLPSIEPIAT